MCLQSASCAADAAGNHRGEHQPLPGQPYRTVQVRPEHKVFTPRLFPHRRSVGFLHIQVSDDAHRSAVPDVGRAADEPELPVPAHLPHHRLPHHRARHPPEHHGEFTSRRRVLFYEHHVEVTSPLPPQVLVVKARCIYRRIVTSNGYLGSEQRASFGVMDRRMVLYPLVFVFCWGPGLFGADSDWFLLTTDAVSEVSAYVCLSCCFLSGDSGVSASGGSRGVPGQSRGGALHPAGESRETRHSHFELVYLFVGVYLFLRLSNSLWLNLCVGSFCALCVTMSLIKLPV